MAYIGRMYRSGILQVMQVYEKRRNTMNTEKKRTIRSPFFYVGDKYKLMPQLKQLMPKHIGQYIEPFVGGGSSFLNSQGTSYLLNDIDFYVVELHRQPFLINLHNLQNS